MANTYLTRTPSSAGNRKTYTFSLWFKRAKLSEQVIFNSTGGGIGEIRLNLLNDNLKFVDVQSGSTNISYITNRKFRDTSGWFHLVLAVDTTQASSGNRVKFYINGEQETSFSSSTAPNQNYDTTWNTADIFQIASNQNPGDYFDGLISHFHFVDGTAYDASAFGETDATTGEWKIKTSPSVTYGTNGFFWLKDSIATTDHSPNSNTFTVAGGTLTKTEDNPSNVFNCFNPLVPTNSTTFSNGNTTLTSGSTQWNGAMTTIPLFGGKWYYECKYINGGNIKFDVVGEQSDYSNMATLNSSYGGYHGNGYGYQFNNSGNDYIGGNNSFPNWSGGLSSNTGNKIFMVAINLENGKIWYGADGTWFNDASGYTGNPTTDAYPHQTISATHLAQKPFIVTGSLEGNSDVGHWNFGNGYFGTAVISSEGTNASGIGKFEYDVPTGFTAISTKGLNE